MVPSIASLWPGHVIRTMVEEHEVIVGFLRALSQLNERVSASTSLSESDSDGIQRLAQSLLDAEPHHQREEQVLFPALEEIGVEGPPGVMRIEHEDLRTKKLELETLGRDASTLEFDVLKARLHGTVSYLVEMLSAHIEKENEILYPMALSHIDDEEDWQQMKTACDEIGYCSFTPAP